MKKNSIVKLSLIFGLLLAVSICAFACNPKAKPVEYNLNVTNLELEEGSSDQLSVSGASGNIVWESLDSNIVEIDNTGKILAIKAGESKIVATIADKKLFCAIKVNARAGLSDKLIVLSYPTLDLKVNAKSTIKAIAINLTGNVTWSSENTNIVTINKSGEVLAIAQGSANVVAKLNDIVVKCKVNVFDNVEIILEKPNDFLLCNVNRDLNAGLYINSEKANVSLLNWTSSDTDVIEVVNGRVYGVNDGVAKITAKYAGVSKSIDYEVKQTVSTVDEFVNMSKTGRYILSNDLDFENIPVGSIAPYVLTTAEGDKSTSNSYLQVNMWEGSFDGNGYALKNVSLWAGNVKNPVSGANDIFHSLFGVIGKNGEVKNFSIFSRTSLASGISAPVAWCNFGRIENVYSKFTLYKDGLNGSNKNAGLVTDNRGTINNCIVEVVKDESIADKQMSFSAGMFGKLIRNNNVLNSFCIMSYEEIPIIGEIGNTTTYAIVITNTEKFDSLNSFLQDANLASYNDKIWSLSAIKIPTLIENYLKV